MIVGDVGVNVRRCSGRLYCSERLLGIWSKGSVSQDCKAKKPAKSAEVTT